MLITKISSLCRPLRRYLLPLAIFIIGALLATPLFITPKTEAATGINEQINYQGRLLTSTGAVVPDGSYNMEFKIVKGGDGCNPTSGTFPCSGTVQWTETRESSNKVLVKNGYFSVYLGSVTPFGSSVDWNDDTLWLAINIGGTATPSYDGVMKPLTRFSSTPYALNSKYLSGLSSSQFIQLAPTSVQADSSTVSSLFVNKTGTSGSILELQKAGADVLVLGNKGNLAVTPTNAAGGTALSVTTADATANGTLVSVKSASSSQYALDVVTDNAGTPVHALYVGGNGKVGIGTNSPGSYQLNVNGSTNLGGSVTSSSLTSCDRVNSDSSGLLGCSQSADLHISKLEISGHSYPGGGGASNAYVTRFTGILASLLHAQEQNHAVGGAIASWNTAGATGDGGYAQVLQDLKGTRNTAPYLPAPGVGLVYYGINDIAATTSCVTGPFIQAERTIISRYRASAVFEESDSSVAFAAGGGGAWSTVNSTNDNSGSGYKSSGGNGNTYTITVPSDFSGGTIDIGLIATQGGNGAVHTFTVDGGAAGSLDTRNIAATVAGKKTGVVKRLTGLSAGAHTIVGTVSSFTGSTYFDYWQIEAAQPRLVVVPKTARMVNYSTLYSTWPCTPTDSDVATLNTAIDSLVAEFDSSVITVDVDAVLGKSAINFAADGAHPNDQGHAKIAAAAYKAIAAASATLDQLSYQAQPSANYFNNYVFQNNNDSTTAFQIQNASGTSNLFNADTTNARIGIGTSTPGYQLDLRNNTNSQIHLMNNSSDTGAWLFGGFGGGWFSANAAFDGVNGWIAKGTTSSALSVVNNTLSYTSNSGLTAGNAFTPTVRFAIDASGNVAIGQSSATARLDVTTSTAAQISILATNTATSGTNIALKGTATGNSSGTSVGVLGTAIGTGSGSNINIGAWGYAASGVNNIQLLLGTTSAPTGSYGIYNASTADNYFAGKLGIGTSGAPSQLLSVGGTTGNFTVSSAGAVVGVGVSSGSGLLQGSGGLTLTGAVSVTNNASNVLGLNTGTSSGQITIGGGSAPLQIDSTNFDVSTAGALSGITTISTSSTINSQTISSAANFTGTVTVQGGNSLTLGVTGTATGAALFKGSTAASGTITLTAPSNPGTYSLTLPTALGSIGDCLKDTTGTGVLGFGACGSGGSTTIGTIDSQTPKSANGATIASNVLYMQTADGTYPGLVSTTSQTIAGAKTFTSALTIQTNSSNALNITDSTGNNGLQFSTSSNANVLKIFGNAAGATNYLQLYYDNATSTAYIAANSGTTQIGTGSGSGGNINLLLSGSSDQLSATKTNTPTAAYSTNDFQFVRNVTGSSYAITGNVMTVQDLTTYTTGSSASNVLYVDQHNSGATGNLILAQTGGSTDRLKVTTAGDLTISGTFKQGSNTGATLSCSAGQSVQNTTVSGGIITGGSCASPSSTLQSAYDGSSSPATITTSSSSKGVLVKAGTSSDSSALFQVQSAAALAVLTVDSTNLYLQVGSSTADANAVLLVLDSYNNATDPAGTNGAMYYNSSIDKFRCYQNSAWSDCLGSRTINKTTDQAATQNSTTMQNDNDLVFPMLANANYAYTLMIPVDTSNATADLSYTISLPSGAAITAFSQSYSTATAAIFCNIIASAQVCSTTINNANNMIVMQGVVRNGATAGNWQFQFAQRAVVAASFPVIKAGATLSYYRQ